MTTTQPTRSPRKTPQVSALLWAASVAFSMPLTAQQTSRAIDFQSESLSVDLRTNKSVYRKVTLSDGSVSIRANEATRSTGDGGDEEWVLSGGLRLTSDMVDLRATEGTVRVSKGNIASVDLSGEPAMIKVVRQGGSSVEGVADHVNYDRALAVFTMRGNASFSTGSDRFACNWRFDLQTRVLSAFPDGPDGTCRASLASRRSR